MIADWIESGGNAIVCCSEKGAVWGINEGAIEGPMSDCL